MPARRNLLTTNAAIAATSAMIHTPRACASTLLRYHDSMEPTTRPSFEPAGAGGLLLGVLLAVISLGLLLGWLAGSAGIGILVGAVVGLPLAVAVVYRRYRDVL